MSQTPTPARDRASIAQLPEFDDIIDVRTPSEFALDHVPGACNLPVLSDDERARVGTIYQQVSPFEAKKLGAALMSANIARHIESRLLVNPRAWRPLVYCWRGGMRSAAFTHVLREIGWDARALEGGYKAYRRTVIAELPVLAPRLRWRVLCGLTGSGKSRLLGAIERFGAQVLDLERLAAHRGSVLGNLPDAPQPTQKLFESRVWDRLRGFDPGRPVYVESESKKIGVLQVPQALLDSMWAGECVQLSVSPAIRVQLLKREYVHFLEDPQALGRQLDCLVPLHGHATIERWKHSAAAGDWDMLVAELLERHYDPAYTRSIGSHYPRLASARRIEIDSPDEPAFVLAARSLMEDCLEPVA